MVKLSRRDVFSPFFLPPCSVFINASGRQWPWGEHRSVHCDGGDMMALTGLPKNVMGNKDKFPPPSQIIFYVDVGLNCTIYICLLFPFI